MSTNLEFAARKAIDTLELINAAAAEGRDGCDVSTESARAIADLREALENHETKRKKELTESAHWRIDVDEDEPERGPFWRGAGADDKDESIFDPGEPLIMDPRHWPPGTCVVVSEPWDNEFYAKLKPDKPEGPLTAEWLLSVGFQKLALAWRGYSLSPAYYWRVKPLTGGHFAFVDSGDTHLAALRSRQDVRDLCRALGCPLKEEG